MEDVLFCETCGAFRDIRSEDGQTIKCRQCFAKVPIAEVSAKVAGTKQVTLLERSELLLRLYGRSRESTAPEEAVIDEECPKCTYPKLSFHTAQLRGVDEGQTIFYTCLNKKCGHKFTVNS